ncbi:mucin-5AC-like [Littorina saxatilis]|uniref:mucin-5AC-like n=1 Tax=Littorina saxatilis TaxID=31220 RepID=UPI0038B4E682
MMRTCGMQKAFKKNTVGHAYRLADSQYDLILRANFVSTALCRDWASRNRRCSRQSVYVTNDIQKLLTQAKGPASDESLPKGVQYYRNTTIGAARLASGNNLTPAFFRWFKRLASKAQAVVKEGIPPSEAVKRLTIPLVTPYIRIQNKRLSGAVSLTEKPNPAYAELWKDTADNLQAVLTRNKELEMFGQIHVQVPAWRRHLKHMDLEHYAEMRHRLIDNCRCGCKNTLFNYECNKQIPKCLTEKLRLISDLLKILYEQHNADMVTNSTLQPPARRCCSLESCSVLGHDHTNKPAHCCSPERCELVCQNFPPPGQYKVHVSYKLRPTFADFSANKAPLTSSAQDLSRSKRRRHSGAAGNDPEASSSRAASQHEDIQRQVNNVVSFLLQQPVTELKFFKRHPDKLRKRLRETYIANNGPAGSMHGESSSDNPIDSGIHISLDPVESCITTNILQAKVEPVPASKKTTRKSCLADIMRARAAPAKKATQKARSKVVLQKSKLSDCRTVSDHTREPNTSTNDWPDPSQATVQHVDSAIDSGINLCFNQMLVESCIVDILHGRSSSAASKMSTPKAHPYLAVPKVTSAHSGTQGNRSVSQTFQIAIPHAYTYATTKPSTQEAYPKVVPKTLRPSNSGMQGSSSVSKTFQIAIPHAYTYAATKPSTQEAYPKVVPKTLRPSNSGQPSKGNVSNAQFLRRHTWTPEGTTPCAASAKAFAARPSSTNNNRPTSQSLSANTGRLNKQYTNYTRRRSAHETTRETNGSESSGVSTESAEKRSSTDNQSETTSFKNPPGSMDENRRRSISFRTASTNNSGNQGDYDRWARVTATRYSMVSVSPQPRKKTSSQGRPGSVTTNQTSLPGKPEAPTVRQSDQPSVARPGKDNTIKLSTARKLQTPRLISSTGGSVPLGYMAVGKQSYNRKKCVATAKTHNKQTQERKTSGHHTPSKAQNRQKLNPPSSGDTSPSVNKKKLNQNVQRLVQDICTNIGKLIVDFIPSEQDRKHTNEREKSKVGERIPRSKRTKQKVKLNAIASLKKKPETPTYIAEPLPVTVHVNAPNPQKVTTMNKWKNYDNINAKKKCNTNKSEQKPPSASSKLQAVNTSQLRAAKVSNIVQSCRRTYGFVEVNRPKRKRSPKSKKKATVTYSPETLTPRGRASPPRLEKMPMRVPSLQATGSLTSSAQSDGSDSFHTTRSFPSRSSISIGKAFRDSSRSVTGKYADQRKTFPRSSDDLDKSRYHSQASRRAGYSAAQRAPQSQSLSQSWETSQSFKTIKSTEGYPTLKSPPTVKQESRFSRASKAVKSFLLSPFPSSTESFFSKSPQPSKGLPSLEASPKESPSSKSSLPLKAAEYLMLSQGSLSPYSNESQSSREVLVSKPSVSAWQRKDLPTKYSKETDVSPTSRTQASPNLDLSSASPSLSSPYFAPSRSKCNLPLSARKTRTSGNAYRLESSSKTSLHRPNIPPKERPTFDTTATSSNLLLNAICISVFEALETTLTSPHDVKPSVSSLLSAAAEITKDQKLMCSLLELVSNPMSLQSGV